MKLTPDMTDPWHGRLGGLPGPLRLTLAAFLAIIGTGYLVAVANIFHAHQLADGRPGLTLDDVRAVYGGLTVDRKEPVPSRMLTMLRTSMRQYIEDDDEFLILENWLTAGGDAAGLDAGEGRKTPRRILVRNCLRCHAQTSSEEIARTAPFGPDDMTIDPAALAHLTATPPAAAGGTVRLPPQYTVSRLVLVSHVHMLSIPMFTLVLAALFHGSRMPRRARAALTPVPMVALVFDFAGWWLARVADGFVYVLAGAGAVFGLAFGLQIVVVLVDLLRGPPALDSDPVRTRHQ